MSSETHEFMLTDRRAAGTSVLHMDGRIDFSLARYFQEDVDLEAGIRGGGTESRAQKDFLACL